MTTLAGTPSRRFFPAFSDDPKLRLILGTLLYLAQGFPQGVTFYAIPAWLAANWQSTAVIGAAASAASLPWALKFLMGPVIDRYTWLPMGRRRPWLIGAQTMIALSFLLFAVLSPPATASVFIIGMVLLIGSMTAVQDTALDALVIDLTPEGEQGRLNGYMLAGKMIGIGGGTGLTSYCMQHYGIRAAMLIMLVLFSIPALAAVLVRERPGEKILPWSPGRASTNALAVTPEAWGPVLRLALITLLRRDTLLVIGVLVFYGIGQTLSDQGSALFAIRNLGWGEGDVGTLIAISSFVLAACCPLLGGPIIDRFGPRTVALVAGLACLVSISTLPLVPTWWGDRTTYLLWFFAVNVSTTLFYLTFLVLAMRVSTTEVAATSFGLIAATMSLGGTLGGMLLAKLDQRGGLVAILIAAATVYCVAGFFPLFASRHLGAPAVRRLAADRDR